MKIHIQEAAVSETKQIKAKIVQIIEKSLQNFNTNFRFEAKFFALKQKQKRNFVSKLKSCLLLRPFWPNLTLFDYLASICLFLLTTLVLYCCFRFSVIIFVSLQAKLKLRLTIAHQHSPPHYMCILVFRFQFLIKYFYKFAKNLGNLFGISRNRLIISRKSMILFREIQRFFSPSKLCVSRIFLNAMLPPYLCLTVPHPCRYGTFFNGGWGN